MNVDSKQHVATQRIDIAPEFFLERATVYRYGVEREPAGTMLLRSRERVNRVHDASLISIDEFHSEKREALAFPDTDLRDLEIDMWQEVGHVSVEVGMRKPSLNVLVEVIHFLTLRSSRGDWYLYDLHLGHCFGSRGSLSSACLGNHS